MALAARKKIVKEKGAVSADRACLQCCCVLLQLLNTDVIIATLSSLAGAR